MLDLLLILFASCVWNTEYLSDLRLFEFIQRRWTKKILGKIGERLKKLDLYSIKDRLLRSDLIMIWKVMNDMSQNFTDIFRTPYVVRKFLFHVAMLMLGKSSFQFV